MQRRVSGEWVVCTGRLCALASNCRLISLVIDASRFGLCGLAGSCFGYLLLWNGASRCPFPPLALRGQQEDVVAVLVSPIKPTARREIVKVHKFLLVISDAEH